MVHRCWDDVRRWQRDLLLLGIRSGDFGMACSDAATAVGGS
jgi:hypothetical protein